MNRRSIIFLISGIGLIFLSLYLFTRPASSDVWDFSNTGQIGDTIGGITAPIINLLGAFLVYISFNAQIKANEIQSKALEDEKKDRHRESMFNKQYEQLLSIKASLTELEFVVKVDGVNTRDGGRTQPVYHVFKGVNAIQESILRLEYIKEQNSSTFGDKYILERYNTYGTFLSFQFILSSILEYIEQVESNVSDIDDKKDLLTKVRTFYSIYIKPFAERMVNVYSKGQEEVEELSKMKVKIDKKFSAQQ